MVSDVPITRETVGNFKTQNVQYSNLPAKVTAQLSQSMIDTSDAIYKQSQKSYLLGLTNNMKRDLTRINEENLGNPQAMEASFISYKDGMFKQVMGQENRDLLDEQFSSETMPYLRKALDTRREVIDGETATQALIAIDSSQQAMMDVAPGLFSKDPGMAFDSARKMQTQMVTIQQSLAMTKSDGSPMFAPQMRATKALAARDSVYTSTALAYLQNQPNKLAAFRQWQKSGIEITLPDENGNPVKVNLKEVMPAETRMKMDAEFTSAVKDQLSITASLNAQADRAFKKNSDAKAAEMAIKAQDGQLTLQDVEANKQQLEPQTYVDMRKTAITADPVSRGDIQASLMSRALMGEDVSTEARTARFTDKSLSNADFFDVLNTVKTQAEENKNPVSSGERYLAESLGGLNQQLDIGRSTAIGGARREYLEEVNRFRTVNNRAPSLNEAMDIADKVIPAWQTMDKKQVYIAARKPMFMSVKEKATAGSMGKGLTPERIKDIKQKTHDYFLQKFGGNSEAMYQDPEFMREIESIELFEDVVDDTEARRKRAQQQKDSE